MDFTVTLSEPENQLKYGFNGDYWKILVDSVDVGVIGIFWKDDKPFIDIFIKPEYRRMGYALEAKRLLYSRLQLKEIYAYVNKDNIASIKLQEKSGFRLIGEEDDKFLFILDITSYQNII